MATARGATTIVEQTAEKGLKTGALGLVSSVVMGVASTAPAYSLAATLGLIVVVVGLGAPIVALLAFIPMLLTSIGYSELNKADPDCGTTFTWAARAFGPRTGWAGGWAIVAADILVMASLAQVAGQYLFLLFGADGIGSDPTSGWVLLVGVVWIIAMTYICYRGIEVSARLQRVLLGVEIVMLLVFSVVALTRVGTGHHPAGLGDPVDLLVQPVPHLELLRVRRRADPDAVHLLGLGHRGRGQRGDQGQGEDAGAGRDPLHGHPARHLRDRDPRRPVVRRHRDDRDRPGQPGQLRRRAVRARQLRCSAARASGPSSPGC